MLSIAVLVAAGVLTVAYLVFKRRANRRHVRRGVVGLFHPHAEDGGGGERVLWSAIRSLREADPQLSIVLYTQQGFTAEELVSRARRNFNLSIDPSFSVVSLKSVVQLDPGRYPRLTLVRQALASVWVAWEGLQSCVPEIWIDTAGWAFAYPLVWWLGSRVGCYVHYPTISSDMLSRVQLRQSLYNNSPWIAQSPFLSFLKGVYYRGFAGLYSWAGSFAEVVMVNSCWTQNHICTVWKRLQSETAVVHPPVDTVVLQQLPLERSTEELYLISVAQFRPEKQHGLQIRVFARALQMAQRKGVHGDPVLRAKLKIVGSCRNEGDQARFEGLKELVTGLSLQDSVEFYENIPYSQLKSLLAGAVAGLHTMIDEHFGIVVVEYMAAGVIPIAHNSGGPKLDILHPRDHHPAALGYLRTTLEDYAEAITDVLRMGETERYEMAERCRERASSFSQEQFDKDMLRALSPLVPRTSKSAL